MILVFTPVLLQEKLQIRLDWCMERHDWSIKEWNEIIWSDESRFCLFSGKRFNPENLVPTVKHGGGGLGPGPYHFIDRQFISLTINYLKRIMLVNICR